MSNFFFPLLLFSKIFCLWFKTTTLIKLLSFFHWVTSFNHKICPQNYIGLSTSVFKYFKYCLSWKSFLKNDFYLAIYNYLKFVSQSQILWLIRCWIYRRSFKSPMILYIFNYVCFAWHWMRYLNFFLLLICLIKRQFKLSMVFRPLNFFFLNWILSRVPSLIPLKLKF